MTNPAINPGSDVASLDEVQTDVGAALTFARDAQKPTILDVGGTKVLVTSQSQKVSSLKPFLDEVLPKPERLRGKATLETLAAFIAHVRRFKDAGSALFARVGASPSLLAVYDYHHGPGDARFSEHRAAYQFPLSREWQAWKAIDGKPMEQAAFAAWLEDHAADVVDPTLAPVGSAVAKLRTVEVDPATTSQVLALSRGVELRVETSVTSKVNLANGSTKLVFDEKVSGEAGTPLTVPGGFAIAIPLFDGGDHYALAVRLRYRVQGNKVLWTLALLGADDVLREAVTTAAERVRADTSLPLFYGAPESAS